MASSESERRAISIQNTLSRLNASMRSAGVGAFASHLFPSPIIEGDADAKSGFAKTKGTEQHRSSAIKRQSFHPKSLTISSKANSNGKV